MTEDDALKYNDFAKVSVEANTICGTDVRFFRGEKTKGIHPFICDLDV